MTTISHLASDKLKTAEDLKCVFSVRYRRPNCTKPSKQETKCDSMLNMTDMGFFAPVPSEVERSVPQVIADADV